MSGSKKREKEKQRRKEKYGSQSPEATSPRRVWSSWEGVSQQWQPASVCTSMIRISSQNSDPWYLRMKSLQPTSAPGSHSRNTGMAAFWGLGDRWQAAPIAKGENGPKFTEIYQPSFSLEAEGPRLSLPGMFHWAWDPLALSMLLELQSSKIVIWQIHSCPGKEGDSWCSLLHCPPWHHSSIAH